MSNQFRNSRMPAAFHAPRMNPAGQVSSYRELLRQRLGVSQIPDATVLQEDKAQVLLSLSDADLARQFYGGYCSVPTFQSSGERDAWISKNPWCPVPPPYISPYTISLRSTLQTRLGGLGYGTADLSSLSDADLAGYVAMSQAALAAVCASVRAPWCPPPPMQDAVPNVVPPPPPFSSPPPISGTQLCRYPTNPRLGQPGVADFYFQSQAARDAWASANPQCPTPPFHPDVIQPIVPNTIVPVTTTADSGWLYYVIGAVVLGGVAYAVYKNNSAASAPASRRSARSRSITR